MRRTVLLSGKQGEEIFQHNIRLKVLWFKIIIKMNHSVNHKVNHKMNHKMNHSVNHKVNLLINKDINKNITYPLYPPWSSSRNLPQPIRNGVLAILLKQNTAMRYWLVYRKMILCWQRKITQMHAGGRKQQSGISKSRRTGFAKIYLCNT